MSPWSEPFKNLQTTVKHLIWATALFGIVISAIALSGLSVATYVLYDNIDSNKANIQRNQDTIVALCRQINSDNAELLIAALDLGVPYNKVQFLLPRPCNLAALRKRYGVE